MAKKDEMITQPAADAAGAVAGNQPGTGDDAMPATPNRDAYSQMWGEDNGDVDFEDKEARYGRAIDDRNELRERRKADSALGGLFENHNWLASMYMELKDNPDLSPFEWLESFCNKNDLSLQEVLDNPEARQRLTKKMNEHQKEQASAKEAQKEKEKNLQKSVQELQALQGEMGLEDADCLKMWGDFWEVVDKASNGLVSKDTWKAFSHSRTYDDDMQSARDEAGMAARNEKIQNNLRKPTGDGADLPPTLSNGAGNPTVAKEPKKRESFLSGLNG